MSKLYLYAAFHANLNFSYIAEDLYPQIVRNCYWPLLRLAEELGLPLGMEFSGYTLETINQIDPEFVRELTRVWNAGGCEVIGCGYTQSIMPLMPTKVNQENLKRGNRVYRDLLGRTPTSAFINEQVFSGGLPKLYREAGFDTLMVNWGSAIPAQSDPENLYRACSVNVDGGEPMAIVWHSLEIYRNFQQYVENEISLDTYLERLMEHMPSSGERSLPIYTSDWEVFDFKPWKVYPDGFDYPSRGEMDRIFKLLSLLKEKKEIEFVAPGKVPSLFQELPTIQLESAAFPLTYKKQSQHSMSRWAVGGRDNVRANTQCNQLYQALLLADWCLEQGQGSPALKQQVQALWEESTYLWASDFRTFTTEDKHTEFRNRMGAALESVKLINDALMPGDGVSGDHYFANFSTVDNLDQPVAFTVSADGVSSDELPQYSLELNGAAIPCQVTRHSIAGQNTSKLTLEAVPGLASGDSAIGRVSTLKPAPSRTSAVRFIDAANATVETERVRLSLLPEFGGAIRTLTFPGVSDQPFINRVNGSQNSLSGDLMLKDWLGRSIDDHQEVALELPQQSQDCEIFVPVRCTIETELGTIWKTYRVYRHQARVDLEFRFQWRDVVPATFRLGRIDLSFSGLDQETLFFAATNGTDTVDRFPLSGQEVLHATPLDDNVSSRACLGATEGWTVVGDKSRGLGFVTRLAKLYSVPMIEYVENSGHDSGYDLSLVHSLGEKDETSHVLWRGHSTWEVSILGGGKDIVDVTRAASLLTNGGLASWPAAGRNS